MPTEFAMLRLDTETLCLKSDKDFIARIPAGLDTPSALFRELRAALRFPDDFSANWNALSDLLRDLSWIPNHRIVIVHDDIPQLDPKSRAIYLYVLADSVGDWKPNEDHELVVLFRGGVTEALSTLALTGKNGRY